MEDPVFSLQAYTEYFGMAWLEAQVGEQHLYAPDSMPKAAANTPRKRALAKYHWQICKT